MGSSRDYDDDEDRRRRDRAYEAVARDEKLSQSELVFLSHYWADSIHVDGTYRHEKSGDVYVAKGLTLREADLQPLVRYHPLGAPGCELSRPLDEWRDRFRRVYAKTVYE